MSVLDELKYDERGLVPAIIQDAENGDVLMMAWMNHDAILRTLETERVTFWSRSRQKYWIKGETSGHIQKVRSVRFDCDGDCLLIQVEQIGAACHEGYRSCFFRTVSPDAESATLNQDRLVDPKTVYGSS